MMLAMCRLALCLAVLVIAALPACSDETKMKEEEFCPAYGRAECATVGRWCAAAFAPEVCESARAIACQQRIIERPRGRRPFVASNAAACIEKVRIVYRSPVVSAESLRDLESTCARAYHGDLGEYALCDQQLECRDGLICDQLRCRVPAPLRPGQSCIYGGACPSGTYCGGTCAPRAGPGVSCSLIPCQEHLRCDDVCVDRTALSEACTSDADCVLPSGFCDPYVGTCAPGLTFSPESAACAAFALGITGSVDASPSPVDVAETANLPPAAP
jgi:hypothetical protein